MKELRVISKKDFAGDTEFKIFDNDTKSILSVLFRSNELEVDEEEMAKIIEDIYMNVKKIKSFKHMRIVFYG